MASRALTEGVISLWTPVLDDLDVIIKTPMGLSPEWPGVHLHGEHASPSFELTRNDKAHSRKSARAWLVAI